MPSRDLVQEWIYSINHMRLRQVPTDRYESAKPWFKTAKIGLDIKGILGDF